MNLVGWDEWERHSFPQLAGVASAIVVVVVVVIVVVIVVVEGGSAVGGCDPSLSAQGN